MPLPPSIPSPFDALLDPEPVATPPPPPPAEPGARRALLDLFPPAYESADEESPPPRKPEVAPPAYATEAAAPEPYETFYGLDEKPFALSTDPRFFYHSTPHDAVSQRLLTAIREREGLVVLTGDIGTGKTTLCRVVVEELDQRTLTSLVRDPFLSGEELLKTVLVDFGVMSRGELARSAPATRHELSTRLQSFVESPALDASAVVIIDEAQNLAPDVLDQVRILTEPAETTSLLQVVLVGQPSLAALLRRPEHKPLHQRVAVRATLDPLPAGEIGAYVTYRLATAGRGQCVTFEDPALARIFQLSRGLPRVVNLICDRALVRGYERSATAIDAACVDAAAEDLDLGEPPSKTRAAASLVLAVVVLALCALLGAGIAAWVFRDAVARTFGQWQGVPPAPVSAPPRN